MTATTVLNGRPMKWMEGRGWVDDTTRRHVCESARMKFALFMGGLSDAEKEAVHDMLEDFLLEGEGGD